MLVSEAFSYSLVKQKKNMDTCVEFKSDLFKPFLSEAAQVNPDYYGAELAWWLSRELAIKGVETTYPKSSALNS
jgi:hypothetical protein